MNDGRLARLLDTPELAWLVDRAWSRLVRGRSLDGPVTLDAASAEQRAAVARLLGRPAGRGASLRVDLEQVDRVLRRAGLADGLADAVVLLRGPLPDGAAARAAAEQWLLAYGVLDEIAGLWPRLATWCDGLRTSGVLRRLVRNDPTVAHRLLTDLNAVLTALPAAGVPLPVFAQATAGRAHALDRRTQLATLATQAAAVLGAVPPGTGGEWRREVWASVGVLVGELTAPVLTIGLPGDTSSATGRALGAFAESGQPVHLTIRQLVRDPPVCDLSGRTISLCENVSVVAAAADRIGAAVAPLVCLGGHPGAAVHALLRLLVSCGAGLRCHADFDWGGVRIAGAVLARYDARPWRYDAVHYVNAVAGHTGRLSGPPAETPWDPALGGAMREHGARVEEEDVVDVLLSDLRD